MTRNILDVIYIAYHTFHQIQVQRFWYLMVLLLLLAEKRLRGLLNLHYILK